MQLQQTGAKPHYVDTDSVIFSCTKKQFNYLNLPIGLSFGKLKEDIKGAKYQNYQSRMFDIHTFNYHSCWTDIRGVF